MPALSTERRKANDGWRIRGKSTRGHLGTARHSATSEAEVQLLLSTTCAFVAFDFAGQNHKRQQHGWLPTIHLNAYFYPSIGTELHPKS
jgi:hypothetical protein